MGQVSPAQQKYVVLKRRGKASGKWEWGSPETSSPKGHGGFRKWGTFRDVFFSARNSPGEGRRVKTNMGSAYQVTRVVNP